MGSKKESDLLIKLIFTELLLQAKNWSKCWECGGKQNSHPYKTSSVEKKDNKYVYMKSCNSKSYTDKAG